MGGLIKIADSLSGALQRAHAAVSNLDSPILSKIGQMFQDSAQANPNYFITSRQLPTGLGPREMDQFLGKKHGIDMYTSPSSTTYLNDGGGMSMNDDGKLGDRQLMRLGLGKYGMTPDTKLYDIDSLMSNRGSGQAKIGYPALWDRVLAQPDAANMTTALTPSNQVRRTANMAGFYEKYGPQANRIIMDPVQLTSASLADADFSNATRFHALDPVSQIGALNSAIASRAGAEVQKVGAHLLARQASDESGDIGQALSRARGLGINPGAPWQATTDVDPSYFSNLASWLHNSSSLMGYGAPASGETSLRRAALTQDALGGLVARDLDTPSQQWLTNGLARKEGGRVPLGPLSEVWK